MRGNPKQLALAGVALVAVVVGLTIALSSGGSHHRHRNGSSLAAQGAANAATGAAASGTSSNQATGAAREGQGSTLSGRPAPSRIAVTAGYLGLSARQLRQRLQQGESLAQIAGATAGKSATGLVSALMQAEEARLSAQKLSPATLHTRLARYRQKILLQVQRVRGSAALERDLLVAARYLGIADDRLHVQLQQGRTLAQVAGAQGKSTAGLVAALVASRRQRLREVAAEGILKGAAAESGALTAVPGQVSAEVHRKLLRDRGSAAGSPRSIPDAPVG